ncbi:hypothetical protein ACIQU8_11805 [Streptomyces griseus]|uniref:hypothetical protein n=1 Tax=Streptomyces griseus TaxID=1911 RepID=UPI003804C930
MTRFVVGDGLTRRTQRHDEDTPDRFTTNERLDALITGLCVKISDEIVEDDARADHRSQATPNWSA